MDLDLARPVGTSAGTHQRRPVILVRLGRHEGPDWAGEGWGEAGALEEGTAVDPPVADVWRALVADTDRLLAAAAARDGRLPEPSVVSRILGDDPAHRMAGAPSRWLPGPRLRRQGLSLRPSGWAGPSGPVAAGAVVGIPADRDPGAVVEAVDALGRWPPASAGSGSRSPRASTWPPPPCGRPSPTSTSRPTPTGPTVGSTARGPRRSRSAGRAGPAAPGLPGATPAARPTWPPTPSWPAGWPPRSPWTSR